MLPDEHVFVCDDQCLLFVIVRNSNNIAMSLY